MIAKSFMLALVLVLAFTSLADGGQWKLTTTGKTDTIVIGGDSLNGEQTYSQYVASGTCTVFAYAYDFTSHDTSTKASISVSNWIRKRYDWRDCGEPTQVTANVTIGITPEVTASANAWDEGTSNAYGYAYASSYASQSGGTPSTSNRGHAKVSTSASHAETSTWSFSLSFAGPSYQETSSGTDAASVTEAATGSVALGGGLTFSQSGAQIFARTSVRVSASQTNGNQGSGNAKTRVDDFRFTIP